MLNKTIPVHISLIFSTFALLLVPLHASQAYTSTAQSAIQLNDTQALFMIDFAFGTRVNDFFIPVLAQSGIPYQSDEDVVGYDVIVDRAEVATEASSTSIVLSDLEIIDGMYRIPAGSNGRFTLLTVITVPAGIADSEYLVQVTSLPHYVGLDRDRRYVNDTELRNFISPGIELNLPSQ